MTKSRKHRTLFSMQLSFILLSSASHAFLETSNLTPACSMSARFLCDLHLRDDGSGFRPDSRSRRQHQNLNSHLCMILGDEISIAPSIEGGHSAFSPHFNSIAFLNEEDPHVPLQNLLKTSSAALTSTTINPDLEAEALTDLAHVGLDFSSFLTPSKSMIRVYSLMGRVLLLVADYIPDHDIRPEELAIQIFMMAVSMSDLVKASRLASTRNRLMNQREKR